MQRRIPWQKLVLLIVVTGVLGLGAASRAPGVRAEPFISATVTIVNQGDIDLLGVDKQLDHGCWTNDVQPPGRIAAHTSVTFESESCGVGTGTEGFVHYLPAGAPDGNNAKFYWDVPTTCCNTADTESPAGCTNFQSKLIDGGNHPDVTFTFACLSSAGDGIADIWKLKGASFDDGTGTSTKAFVDLPSMGANVNRKQIFLQIDWMQDGTHNQQLSAAAIKSVGDVFAAHGIDLIIDAGPTSINRVTGQQWGALSRANQRTWISTLGSTTNGTWDWTEFQEFRDGTAGDTCAAPDTFCFKQTGRRAIFHYAIAAFNINGNGTSGISTGSDIAISLGSWTAGVGSLQEQSGTLMHELGHNLGLGHGGSDAFNAKANYVSVMNYLFQMTGVTRNGVTSLDYSPTAFANLNETTLSEGTGAAPAGAAIEHWCPGVGAARGAYVAVADGSQPIDWNCNGVINAGTVNADTNGDSICVEPGANGTIETVPAGDDVLVGAQILTGPNRICDTAVYASDDAGPGSTITAFMPVGSAQPNPLAGADDWDNLKLKNGAIGGDGTIAPGPAPLTPLDDITPAQQKDILPIDTTPPVTSEAESATPPRNAAGWYRSAVTVALSAHDDISGVARTEYNLDGSGWVAYSSPFVVNTEAVHTLLYRSIDRSQNVETASSATIRLDKTAPQVGLTGFTPNGQNGWYTSKTAGGGVTASDALSGLASIACTDDLGGLTPTSASPAGASSATLALTLTKDGVHHLSCTATDVAGNAASTTLTVKVDSAPPSCAAAATPNSLWPPNHKLVAVVVTLQTGDAGSGLQSVTGVKPSSNEDMADIAANVLGLNVPTNSGSTNGQRYLPAPPDSTGPQSYAATLSGQVRAERDGNGPGRTYTLTYTATDMAGNVANCAATVDVTHDQGN